MDIYKLQLLLESMPFRDFTPKVNDDTLFFQLDDYTKPSDAVKTTWGTQTSFKPGHDNSKAVAAARAKTLGVSQSETHKAKRAAALRKRVCVDGLEYNSITEASIALGIGKPAISNRIKRGHTAWLI